MKNKHLVFQKIAQQSPHLSWIPDNTIYLVRHGSWAYGTNVASSDEDFKGVAIPTKPYFLGSQFRFEQAELKDPDTVIYEIRKFFNLAAQCNPNIIEVLFVDPSDIIHLDDIGEEILANRDKFLSKRVKHSMSGYAMSQLKRIKLHRRWLLNPVSEPPTRASLGLPEHTLIPQDQLLATQAAIQKEIDRFQFDFMEELSEPMKIAVSNAMSEMLAELKITDERHWNAAARKIGLDDNFIALMQREREYTGKKREWEQYQNWKATRNPKRAADEAKYGYDCYVEETEFLTNNGWKKYDEVKDTDLLATLFVNMTDDKMTHRTNFGVEYQAYTERFEGTFTGNLYNLVGYHTDVLVSPNHRMLVRSTNSKTGLPNSEWELEEIANVGSRFEIVRQITPLTRPFTDKHLFEGISIADVAFMRLMGWYLSEGSVCKYIRKDGSITPKYLSLSQKKGGRLHHSFSMFAGKYSNICVLKCFKHKPDKYHPNGIDEIMLHVRDKFIVKKIYQECGDVKEKRIPRWVFSLSKRKMEILLDAMMMGDGTWSRPDNSLIYYSSVKQLADDFQELAFFCGFETSLYGPYTYLQDGKENTVYQVHVNKTREQFRALNDKSIRKVPVENKRIVCFTVPNSILITRYNGHIGIHGNSKHAYHLVRLMRMAREILTTGKVIVKRPDREELLAIRNGAWNYDQLIEFAEKEDKELTTLYQTSNILSKTPDFDYLDRLCIKLIEKSLSKFSWYRIKKALKIGKK
jgi:predicted nucleotidyltransferase